MIDKRAKKQLVAAGWKFGTVAEFLQLASEEKALVELKVQLSDALRERRKKLGITQNQLAKKLNSSQSRVAKMEADDPTVSIDLLIRGLLSTGIGLDGLSKIVSPRARKASKAR
jgi:ribosome-binding protein aMBF1 (putative translation factor)